jgi:hypothetical protein
MKKNLLASLLLLSSGLCFSQGGNTRVRCATMEHEAYLESQNPNRKAERAAYAKAVEQWIASNPDYQSRAVITIPVVIHIVYTTSTPASNISDAQALAQIKTLNEDYSYTNADGAQTPSAFKSLAANTGIQFCMAKVDPNGQPTTGIVRKSTTVKVFGTDDKVKSASSGGDNAWDTKKYLNIWTCDLGTQILGYGEFPTGSQTNTYGLVCHYNTFGEGGATFPPYNLGRTSTHEIGHCFNLKHIWGDEPACAADDDVSDTPMQKAEHYNKPSYPETVERCNSSDPSSMFMNYMDYTDDDHMNMFTKGQSTRMNAVLSSGPYSTLKTSTACGSSIGVSETSALDNSLYIYPNPASKYVDVEFALTDNNSGSIEVYNAVGQKMFSEDLDKMNAGYKKYSLDVTSFANGLYFITVKVGDSAVTRKISVVK